MTTLRRMISFIDAHTLWAFNPQAPLDRPDRTPLILTASGSRLEGPVSGLRQDARHGCGRRRPAGPGRLAARLG